MNIIRKIRRVLPDGFVLFIKDILLLYENKKMLIKYGKIRPFKSDKYPFGINLIGDIKAETGLGQSMRIIAGLLEEANLPFVICQIDAPGELEHSESMFEKRIVDKPVYSINLIHINPNTWAETYNRIEEEWLHDRYPVAYWLWELEQFPDKWKPCMKTVREIWAPSDFICESIKNAGFKRVTKMPYAIQFNERGLLDRDYFSLPKDLFLFLIMYDEKSISERKNPWAAINAYKEAFNPDNHKVGVVIKVSHTKDGKISPKLRQALHGYPNVFYVTDNLSREEVESLIASVNVLVSLHRSEGFGLPLAEAMYLGTVAVATNWSANIEFMKQEGSELVVYKLIQLKKTIGPYRKGSRWADADVADAANRLKHLMEDKNYYENKKNLAASHIRTMLNPRSMAERIRKRVNKIQREHI